MSILRYNCFIFYCLLSFICVFCCCAVYAQEESSTALSNNAAVPPAVAPSAVAAVSAPAAVAPSAVAPPAGATKLQPASTAHKAMTHLLVLGGAQAKAISQGLANFYQNNPHIVVIPIIKSAQEMEVTPLSQQQNYIDTLIAQYHPELIILCLAADSQNTFEDGQYPSPVLDDHAEEEGTEEENTPYREYFNAYQQRNKIILQTIKQHRLPALWVEKAPVEPRKMRKFFYDLNQIDRKLVEESGSIFVPLWDQWLDEQQAIAFWDETEDGEFIRLREPNGVGFTPSGANRLGAQIALVIEPLLPASERELSYSLSEKEKTLAPTPINALNANETALISPRDQQQPPSASEIPEPSSFTMHGRADDFSLSAK